MARARSRAAQPARVAQHPSAGLDHRRLCGPLSQQPAAAEFSPAGRHATLLWSRAAEAKFRPSDDF
jgi:hypothetical protein